MTQYNIANIKLSDLQLNELKLGTKNKTEILPRLSLNMIGYEIMKTDVPYKLLLTNRQVANLCKAFTNNLSTDVKLSKTQLWKIIQSGGFLGRLFTSLLKAGLGLT